MRSAVASFARATRRVTVATSSWSDRWESAGVLIGMPSIYAPDLEGLERPHGRRSEARTPRRATAKSNGAPRRSSSVTTPFQEAHRRSCRPRCESCQGGGDLYSRWCDDSEPRDATSGRPAARTLEPPDGRPFLSCGARHPPPAGVDAFVQFDRLATGALGYLLVSDGEALEDDVLPDRGEGGRPDTLPPGESG